MDTRPVTPDDFTTSADTSTLTPEQEQNLLDMAQFFEKELSIKHMSP